MFAAARREHEKLTCWRSKSAPVVHAILLSGGSSFGLDAATGVMRYLEERAIGIETRATRVPLVPAAILYDLASVITKSGRTQPPDIAPAKLRAQIHQSKEMSGRGPVRRSERSSG